MSQGRENCPADFSISKCSNRAWTAVGARRWRGDLGQQGKAEPILLVALIAEGSAIGQSFPQKKKILPVLFRSGENALLWVSGCWGYAGMQMPKMPWLQLAPVLMSSP